MELTALMRGFRHNRGDAVGFGVNGGAGWRAASEAHELTLWHVESVAVHFARTPCSPESGDLKHGSENFWGVIMGSLCVVEPKPLTYSATSRLTPSWPVEVPRFDPPHRRTKNRPCL
jgi:hypothetical protein